MLVGNSSAMTFLVNAETESNPYVAARPFRINAGAVHAYCQMPGDTTRYLEELTSGSEVLIAAHTGETKTAVVGRVKTEIRPMLLITAEVDGREGKVFLQNAETIRLVTPEGKPVSVVTAARGRYGLVSKPTWPAAISACASPKPSRKDDMGKDTPDDATKPVSLDEALLELRGGIDAVDDALLALLEQTGDAQHRSRPPQGRSRQRHLQTLPRTRGSWPGSRPTIPARCRRPTCLPSTGRFCPPPAGCNAPSG